MQRLDYTSQLTSEDIKLFLLRYAKLNNCIILKNDIVSKKDRIFFFLCGDRGYKMVCSDFSLRVARVFGETEAIKSVVRPSEDDWLCFLKGKFGKEYVNKYVEAFNASDIVLSEPKFISKLSYHSMLIMIRNILVENNNKINYDMANTEIIEVESFYRPERRFLICDRIQNRCFYMRISDFGVITPSLNSSAMFRVLIGKFGKEYVDMFNKSIYMCINHSSSSDEECNENEAVSAVDS